MEVPLIDRKDPKQAIPAIKGLGSMKKHHRSAVIFQKEPEVREAKAFAQTGLKYCKTRHRHM
jgi:1-acyl-sn-glycerol-3-phosphate acyltransferase